MAARNYDASILRVLAHEGGYTNHPSDPGGPTNWGITIHDARRYWKGGANAADVKAMPRSVAVAIYRAKYWDALRCDDLPPGVDYAMFDYGVNSGIGRAGKVLRRVLGVDASDWKVTDAVLAQASLRKPEAVVRAICDERDRFLRSLKTWPVFGKGWARRVNEVRKAATAMANNVTAETTVTVDFERAKGTPAKPAIANPSVAAATAAVTPIIASGATTASGFDSEAVLIVAIVMMASIIFVAGFISRRHKKAAETPMIETEYVTIANR